MARRFLTAIDLAQNELQNASVQNLASAPSSPVKGQLYFNSTGGNNTLYWWDGTAWVPAKASGTIALSGTVSNLTPGNAAAAGVGTTASAGDHVHGLPAFAAPATETTFGLASATGSASTFVRSDHLHGTPTHLDADHSAIHLNALASPNGDVSFTNYKLINVGTPTAASDGASKNYVDTVAQGLDAKQSCRVATTANIAAFGAAPTTIDGVTMATGDRVLVKDQAAPGTNGIYYYVSPTTMGRATDQDSWAEFPSAYVWVEEGTVWKDTGWVCTADQGGTVGTTPVTWVQFSSAGSAIAGGGLTKTGNTLDVGAGTGITVAADTVAVDSSVVALKSDLTALSKKYAGALTGTASPETVTHNLNTRDVAVEVLNGASPYTAVDVDWDATTVNTIVIRYSPTLGAGYRVVVVG